MKKLITLTSMIFVFNLILNAQTPPPPPPPRAPPPPPAPLIYKAPDKSSVLKFDSDEMNFSIDFAGVPTKTKKNNEDHSQTILISKLKGSNEIVSIKEFPVDIESKFTKKEIIDYLRANYLIDVDNRIVHEKDVESNGLKFYEFGIDKNYEFERTRVFIIRNRIYELKIDVTNWHILKEHNADKVAEFNSEANRFFSSFKVDTKGVESQFDSKQTISNNNFQLKIPEEPNETYSLRTDVYTNKKAGFKVKFPRKPTTSVRKVEVGFGATDYHTIIAPTGIALYGVTYLDYPAELNSDVEKQLSYREQLNEILKQPNFRKISEEKITIDGREGMKFAVTNGLNRINLVMFFAKQRFFRMIFGHSEIDQTGSSYRAKIVNKNLQDLANAFFDSFRVTQIPKAQFERKEFPADFGVSLQLNSLTIDRLKFNMTIPFAMDALSDEDNSSLKQSVKDDFEKESDTSGVYSIDNTIFLFSAAKFKDDETVSSTMLIAVEKSIFPNFKSSEVIRYLMKNELDADEKPTTGIEKTTYDSVEFSWFESYFANDKSKQRIYVANVDGHSFQIVFTFESETDLNEFLESLKTIKFYK